jgi:hypothetical protein
MNALKPALIAASIAFAGPALADGGALFGFVPTLTFPAQEAVVSQNKAPILAQSDNRCTVLERDAGIQPDACGTLSKSELVKRKFAREE